MALALQTNAQKNSLTILADLGKIYLVYLLALAKALSTEKTDVISLFLPIAMQLSL